ncbi:DUF917 domain-containing protein [Niveispirillum sp. KHB5.9]|uniref:DUF917 domain-containing protein n=1 Tax=Niveispirillum sp. KHB5.9 TaxID=3400269 RepID=UPI003A84EB97
MQITINDLVDFTRGAAFLGTGGGGDPYVGRLLLKQEMENGRTITIMRPQDVADDALVVPIAAIGAPSVMLERAPKIEALEKALSVLEKKLGRKADALSCIESGGINATLPLILAARTGLPVVDADGMGRAFPELQMVTFNIYGLKASPFVMTNDRCESVTFEVESNHFAEQLARSTVMAMAGAAHLAIYPMSGRQLKDAGVPGTLSLALDIGRAIVEARRGRADPVRGLLDFLRTMPEPRHAVVLAEGKVVDIRRETRDGFNFGRVLVQPFSDASAVPAEIVFRNEYLTVKRGEAFLAMVPDLVCVLDAESAEPITTETLKYGARVKVVGVSVPPVMRTGAALATFGPRAFGIDSDYLAIEGLVPA